MAHRNQISTEHLNVALNLAQKRGFQAKDITSLTVGQSGGVTIELPTDDGFAHFVSNRGLGM